MQQADDLALGEHRAHGTHPRGAGGGQGRRSELVDLAAECPGHHLEEPAGAGGALVVHLEVKDAPCGIEADHLGVLTADVEDRARGRVEGCRPQGIGTDLRDDFGPEVLRRSMPPVPGSAHTIERRACRQFRRDLLRLEARVEDGAVGDRAVLEPYRVDGARADVQAEDAHQALSISRKASTRVASCPTSSIE